MPAEWEARVWGLVDQARRSAAILEVLEADRRHFNFLVRLRQLRKNCGKLIEYLVPALQLTTFFRVLHGLVSDESQFRLAVSKVLKSDHVIGAIAMPSRYLPANRTDSGSISFAAGRVNNFSARIR